MLGPVNDRIDCLSCVVSYFVQEEGWEGGKGNSGDN